MMCASSFVPGRTLPLYYRCVALLIHGFYFARVSKVGATPPPGGKNTPRLIISSHRNGAIDGYSLSRLFPEAQFLTSVQLLRSRLLRFLFTGIPVVRDKDRERYGFKRAAFNNPVEAGCAHLRAGGDLAVFPEGSSEWGWRPLPYQRGAARIACMLVDEGVAVQVIPIGLYYTQPDRFRSCVELLVGEPVILPVRDVSRPRRFWENSVHAAISDALDQVSVNCPDAAAFAAAERNARAAAASGRSYAEAFVATQQALRRDDPGADNGITSASPKTDGKADISEASGNVAGERLPKTIIHSACCAHFWDWPFIGFFMLLCAPVLLAGYYAGTRADARNTVTFFRMAAGFAVAWLWVPILFALTLWQPLPMLAALAAGAFGWWRYPHR